MCGPDTRVCFYAAYHGLAMLQWARANGCEWANNTSHAAAAGGHLDALQWARANGCDWYADTCSAAARGGHLAML